MRQRWERTVGSTDAIRLFANCAESEHAPAHRSTKKSVKHPGRQELPANLPRVERILPCALNRRVCKRCGKGTAVIDDEESSQLDVEPAKYFVLVDPAYHAEWYPCRDQQRMPDYDSGPAPKNTWTVTLTLHNPWKPINRKMRIGLFFLG
jgi:hypothetical protein